MSPSAAIALGSGETARTARPAPDGGKPMKKLLDSWAGIGVVFVVLAVLGAIWAASTV